MRVFVASSGEDDERVEHLRRALGTGRGWQAVEIRARIPEWQSAARLLITSADALLFVTSPQSFKSEPCRWELNEAMSIGKPCFQWIIEPVDGDHPATRLPVVKRGTADDAHVWTFLNSA